MRGLAALLVAVSHMLSVYELPSVWRVGLDAALNAHAAVILFFVLSGYVLSASLLRGDVGPTGLILYYVRRLFRIYPAVWVASGFSALIILTVGSNVVTPIPSAWFQGYMSPIQMNAPNVLLSLVALKSYLIAPIGTILIELVGSFVLPFFVLMTAHRRKLMFLLLPALVGLAFLFSELPHRLDAFAYLLYFALGMAVRMAPSTLQQFVKRRAGFIAVLGLVVLLFFRAAWFLLLSGQLQPLTHEYLAPSPAIIEGFASAALIAAVVNLRGRLGWLGRGPLASLGDISYSFYLLHFPIMAGLARTLSPIMTEAGVTGLTAALLLLCSGLAATIPLSLLVYGLVERPGIDAGRWFAAIIGLAGRPGAPRALALPIRD